MIQSTLMSTLRALQEAILQGVSLQLDLPISSVLSDHFEARAYIMRLDWVANPASNYTLDTSFYLPQLLNL